MGMDRSPPADPHIEVNVHCRRNSPHNHPQILGDRTPVYSSRSTRSSTQPLQVEHDILPSNTPPAVNDEGDIALTEQVTPGTVPRQPRPRRNVTKTSPFQIDPSQKSYTHLWN